MGRLVIPPSVDPAAFVLSDGKLETQADKRPATRFGELIEAYREALPLGAKEPSTIEGENIHIEHLLRHFGRHAVVEGLVLNDVQSYVKLRSAESYRDSLISVDTIKKELATFRMLWNWAISQELVGKPCPTRGVLYPKRDAKPPFMTRDEIERIIQRGGLSDLSLIHI